MPAGGSRFRLRLPADPAQALTARTFVAAGCQLLGLDAETSEDLKLAASELLTHATDVGSAEIELILADDGTLSVDGVVDLDRGSADLPVNRGQLLRALFPQLRQDGTTVIIPPAALDPV